MAGRGLRRTMTISDQTKSDLKPAASIGTPAATNSPSSAAAASSSPVGGMPSPCRGGRTLIDIIREEQKMNESGSKSGSIRDSDNGTVNWKSFKDRIRLRRAGNAWSEPESEYYPPPNPNPNPNPNSLFARSFSGKSSDEDPPVAGEPAKMSLMALFEQTEGGGFGSEEEEDDDDEDYDDGDDDGDGDDGGDEGMYHACCVCMVRHKGPAFIPCGHTFCRLCSKELFVSRGNCPLCNGFILEILNIF